MKRVHKRCIAWLRRHGPFDERPLEERSNETAESDAIGACAAIAMDRGAITMLSAAGGGDGGGASNGASSRGRFVAEHEGFNVHAGVHIAAGDDMGRERLCRYGLRPPMSLERRSRQALRDDATRAFGALVDVHEMVDGAVHIRHGDVDLPAVPFRKEGQIRQQDVATNKYLATTLERLRLEQIARDENKLAARGTLREKRLLQASLDARRAAP